MRLRKTNIITLILFICVAINLSAQQNWTHKVRIAGNPLSNDEIGSIINKAKESFVFGIEVDNDITGRYESFLDPTDKLETIRRITEEAHKINNKTFVYIAGLECITSNADSKINTFFKDHPDWVQRDITGRPAIFGSKDAFWISEGDEDVWISPYAMEWRKLFMQRVREIAATGIDGIYVDIPYWMTHFEGWENTWASFDDYTVAEFKKQTGLDAKSEIEIGNYNDAGFIKWIKFRMQSLTDFMDEINKNIKEINPDCKTIAEIYPGISEEAVRVGADVFKLYEVVDVIAHEYSEGEYYASDRAAYDWYNYIIGMQTFRAFAEDKSSWMLSYSWLDNKNVTPSDAMKSLFASQIFTGTNMWDVEGYIMSSTNDMKTRAEVYKWVSENEDIFYAPRIPFEPISVYFSDVTRNYFSEEFINSFRGIVSMLMHSHLSYRIVTSRTIEKLSPKILILPDVKCLSNAEINSIKTLYENGTHFIITEDLGIYNENREPQNPERLSDLFSITKRFGRTSGGNYDVFRDCPGKSYTENMKVELNNYFNSQNANTDQMLETRNLFISDLLDKTSYVPKIKIDAPIELIATTSLDEKYIYLFLTNIKRICEACESNIKTIKDIKISYSNSVGSEEIFAIPFLGDKEKVKARMVGNEISFTIPEIERGIVIVIRRN